MNAFAHIATNRLEASLSRFYRARANLRVHV